MVLFFYGQNAFLLSHKLNDLKEKYRQSSKGNFDLVQTEGENFNFEQFKSQTLTMPLFATSRLVVVKNLFSCKSKEELEKLKSYLDEIPKQTVVVFTHAGSPDKRLSIFKALNKPKLSQEFKEVDDYSLPKFVEQEVKEHGGEIDRAAAVLLAEMVGKNLWQISNEAAKLVTYKDSKRIEKEDVALLVTANPTSNIFSLIDSLANSKKALALKELGKLFEMKEPALKILSMINYQYRMIAQVKDALTQSSNSFQVAKICSISDFQVKKSVDLAKKISWKELGRVYSMMLNFDELIKTGKIKPEEGLKELVLNI